MLASTRTSTSIPSVRDDPARISSCPQHALRRLQQCPLLGHSMGKTAQAARFCPRLLWEQMSGQPLPQVMFLTSLPWGGKTSLGGGLAELTCLGTGRS